MRSVASHGAAPRSALELTIGIVVVGLGILLLIQVAIIALAQLRAESIAREGVRAAAISVDSIAIDSSLGKSSESSVFALDDWELIETRESVELFVTGSAYSLVPFEIDVSASSKIGLAPQ